MMNVRFKENILSNGLFRQSQTKREVGTTHSLEEFLSSELFLRCLMNNCIGTSLISYK